MKKYNTSLSGKIFKCFYVALLFFVSLLSPTVGWGQSTANYSFITGSNGSLIVDMNSNTIDMSTGTTLLIAAGSDDTPSGVKFLDLNTGTFSFSFLGTAYTQFAVSDNGVITLGNAATGTSVYALPNNSVPTIAAFANDLRCGTDGKVEAKVFGTLPNRTLVIQWTKSMIRYLSTAAAGTATWQVRLYEGTGVIEFIYGAMTTNTATPTTYYIGFSNNTTANNIITVRTSDHTATTSATVYSNTYTASSTITALNSSADGSRRYYRFTPSTNYYWGGTTGTYSGAWTTNTPWGTTTSSGATKAWPVSGNYNANFSGAGTATIPSSISVLPCNVLINAASNTFNTSGSTGSLTSTIALGSNTLTLSPASATYSLSLSGVISGTGGITNTTGTTILSGTNTYTGATTISSGTIKLGNSAALGTTAGSTSVTSGAALDLNGTTYSTAEPLTLNGTGISSGGALTNSSSTAATFAGPITLGNASSIVGGTGSITISGTLTNATYGLTLGGATGGTVSGIISGTGALAKADAGAWTLAAANTYTGATTINAGTLTLGAANALPITTSAGTIQFAGGTPILNLGLYNLGSSTASANSAGQLDFDVNTTVNLGASGTNAYYFKASTGQTWNATTITIYNWTGTVGVSGTGPKIYVGSDATGLSATQLAKITFNGYSPGAIMLSTGEVVPAPVPTITSLGATSGCVGSSLTINGTNLTGATAANVKIGGTAVSSITSNTGTAMVVVVGTGTTGTVAVTTAGGTATSASTYTVNSLPAISGTVSVCTGSTTTLTGSITPGTWGSSNTGVATVNSSGVVSGVATGSATITYTVTATGCTATASVTVSTAPTINSITATPSTICSGANSQLLATSNSGGSKTLGAGGTTASDNDGVFYHLWGGLKSQFLVKASELSALGITAGNISSLGINIASGGGTYASLNINIATTALTAMSGLVSSGFSNYYSNASYTTTTGINTFTLSSPFVWDGTSNIIIEFCWSNNNSGGTSNYAKIDAQSFVSCAYYRADSETPAVLCAATTASGTTSNRPQFIFTQPVSLTYSWSPATFLSATNIANPLSTGMTSSQTYTVTVSSGGCNTTGTVSVNVSAGGVTINTQPTAATKCTGETATFSVTASSPVNLTYQWRKGGVNMNTTTYPSAATATLTLTGVSASDAGNYDVVITPACGSSVTSNAVALIVNPTATVTLASNSPAVTAASIYLSSTKNPIYRFTLATNNNGINATLTQLTFTTTNTSASDITKYQLWYNSSDVLGSATQIGSNITSSLGSGTHTFSSLSQTINANTTGYFWITADVASGASPSNTIVVSALTTSNITATYSNGCGSITGSTSASGTQTIGCYSLSGTVSVGSGQTYTSLTGSGGLFAAINSCGLTGNLTVNITSNLTEDGTNALNQWTGAYTVTIQPSAATLRTISGCVSQAMIRLNGADGLTIDGRYSGSGQYLKFKNTNTGYAVISIANASTNNTIKYCLIEAGEYGIYQNDATSTSNAINNCSIYDFDDYGVYLSASTSTTISQNVIYQTSQKSSSCYGIYLGNAPSTIIEKNKIFDLFPGSFSTAYGIYYYGSSGVNMNVIIRNNMIALSPNNDYYVYGIEYNGYTANSCDIYFNSIYIGGTGTSAYSSYGIAKAAAATTFNCKNNIVYNNRTASTSNQYALYFSNTTGTIGSDYNNLYSPTVTYGYVGYWSSTTCQTIANWRTASSKDASSINLNPNYTAISSPFDLHLTAGSCKTGTTISGITDDFDSQSRTTPCIGADELYVCSGTPTAGSAIASSTTVCSGSLSTISVTGATTGYSGLTYQWQSSSDNSSWADISSATGLYYSAYPTVNTYYRRKITCSGSSTYSSSVLVSVTTCYTMDNASVTTCSGLFYDSGGASANYSDNESYTKTFTSATAGNALQFTFSAFHTESTYDYLYVYDGPTTASTQITGSPFSGNTLPSTILSNGSSLTFKFTSESSTNYEGWEASIACVPITVPNCATLTSPTNGETTVCPGSGATLTWTAPTTGFAPTSYQVYFGTNNPPTNIINGTNMGNVTTYSTGPLGSNTTYYWKIVPVNSIGINNTCSTVYSFTTQNISISSTNSPVTTCLNTATLTATGGGTINWYDQPTGGSAFGTGGSYNPTFSGNTTYYVGASNGSTAIYTVGLSGPNTNSIGSSSMGLWFTTSAPLTINTVDVYVTTAGTNLTVHLQNSSSTDILTQSFTNLPAGKNTLTLNFSIPTAGTYILVSKDGVSLGYESSYSSYPITIAGILSITSGEYYGTDSGIYGYFYNWKVTAGSSCESARVPVNVIHTASPITITPDGSTTFALGSSVGLTASSSSSPAYTYTWSPSAGLNTTTGTAVTATPNSTTTYTVVGTNGTPCTQTATVTVEVILPCTGLGSTGVTNISALPYSVSGKSLVGTGNEITSSTAIVCGSTDYYTGEDAVYTFTPTVSGSSTIELIATTGTYTGLMLYDGCPMNGQGGTCVSYSQSSTGSKTMCVSLTAGTTYYLVVDYYSSSATVPSNYSLSITAPDPASTPNDLPCNARVLNTGDLTPGENTCATGIDEPVAPSCWTNGTINTVWYKLTTGTSQTSIKVKTVVGSLLNTQIALYSGTCGSGMSLVACNDDVSACGSSSYKNSELTATVTPNTTYYVAVDGYSDLTGTFSIVWTDGAAAWPPVPGQDCGTEIPVCSATFAIGNPGYQAVGNNCDFGTSYCLASGERGSAWYEIKINANGNLMFTLEPNDVIPAIGTAGEVTDDGTDYDWAIWQKTGSAPVTCAEIAAGTATPLRCNFSSIGITGLYTSGLTPSGNVYTNHTYASGAYDGAFEEPIPVLSGETYYIVVSNFSNSLSGFTINFTNSSSGFDFTVPDPLIWTGGAASTDWFDSRNWGNCSEIPDDTHNCVIAASSSYQPVINASGAKCKSITINPGATLTINNGYNLDVYGNYNNQGSLVANPTSTVTMTGGDAQTMDGIMVTPSEFNNLTISKTGNSVTANQNIEVGGNLILSTSGYGLNGNNDNIFVAGNIDMANTTFTPGATGTFTIIGNSTTHTINGRNNVFSNFTMNQTGQIILSNNITLNTGGVLTLTNGLMNTGPNTVIVTNTDPNAVTVGNASSYINGNIRRYIASNSGTYAFPVGTSSAYRLAEIINNNMTGVNYINGMFSSTFSNTGSLNGTIANDFGTPYTSFAPEGIWTLTPDVQPSGGSYGVNLWFNGGGSNAFGGLTDYAFGPLKRTESSTTANLWSSQGGSLEALVGRTVADGYARRDGWNTFSEFGIGKASGALPVTLLNAHLSCNKNTKILSWSTASEQNNDYFSIFSSINAVDFTEITRVRGAGNSNNTHQYQWTDTTSRADEVIYYQLSQTDNNGVSKTLGVFSGKCNNDSNNEIIIISNPSNPNIELQFVGDFTGKYTISVINYLGQVVIFKEITLDEQKAVVLSKKGLASGLYNLVFKGKTDIITKQVLVSY